MIAIVYPQFYGVGGIARYLDSFLSNLPPDHPPIYLLTGDEHRMERRYPGIEIIHVPFSSNRLNLFIWGWRVRRLLTRMYAEGKIRYVNLHIPPLIPGLMLPRHIPLVLTAHTTYLGMSGRFYAVRHFDSQWSRVSLAIKRWMERRIFARAERIIALTEQGRQEVVAYGYGKPIEVIPNGADASMFSPDGSTAKELDVLFCGRIEVRKGSRAMVELCRQLVAAKPDIRIGIIGYGDDDAWVGQELMHLANNVVLAGKVPFPEMIGYYNRSRIYVSTSYYEGLPGTCLEAMAMCLPTVVWDFLFYRGLVEHGATGFSVPVNDFSAMRNAVMRLLAESSVATEMGSNGRKRILEDYCWPMLARKVLQALQA